MPGPTEVFSETFLLQRSWLMSSRPSWSLPGEMDDLVLKRLLEDLTGFLFLKGLLSLAGLSRSWVEFPFVSDHAPIFFQLESSPLYKAFPFKFNDHWLLNPDFIKFGSQRLEGSLFSAGR
jgi:hypothetical protein